MYEEDKKNASAASPIPTARQAALLLDWYDQKRRILPWREDPTPYHVWLSEIMLQQTRVEAAIGYYERFLKELPEIRDLAAADERQYLKLWEGLGYYSRIRNMHKAAVKVMEDFNGELPSEPAELESLPGIGHYTACAIASIAFGRRTPAVDGNLLRVFSRLTLYADELRSAAARKDAEHYYDALFPAERPGDFNQALMDLGATICLPNGTPHCADCPWKSLCQAHRIGCEEAYPKKTEKAPRKIEKRTIFLVTSGPLILLRKRPETGLLAGLCEFPGEDGTLTRKKAEDALSSLGIRPVAIEKAKPAKHVFSHVEWRMTAWRIEAESLDDFRRDDPGPGELFAVPLEQLQSTYPIPSAFAPFLRQLT
ncbi:MAG: A/G-specific adenine glycosylase [Anaerovoracaceae bacterium]|jgi:A/G-specific adenine glycosylase